MTTTPPKRTNGTRARGAALAGTAVLSSAALLAGAGVGEAAAAAQAPTPSSILTPTQTPFGTSWLGGVPMTMGPNTSATAIGPGMAVAVTNPRIFGGTPQASAFSILGIAAASDVSIFGQSVGSQVTCLGALTYAHSGLAGTCLNVLGIFDVLHDKQDGSLSFALTNPAKLLTDGVNVGDLAEQMLAGTSVSRLLTADFARITFGGKDTLTLTSDYAFNAITGAANKVNGKSGAVLIEWLGNKVLLFPETSGGRFGMGKSINYLGLPSFDLGHFNVSGLRNIIPTLTVGSFGLPIPTGLSPGSPNLTIPGWSTGTITSGIDGIIGLNAAGASAAVEHQDTTGELPTAQHETGILADTPEPPVTAVEENNTANLVEVTEPVAPAADTAVQSPVPVEPVTPVEPAAPVEDTAVGQISLE